MKAWVLVTAGIVATLLGVVWTLQGVGVLTGSPMTGQQLWLIIGVLLAAAGLVLLASGVRKLRENNRA